jgi:signal transduction histidine kinase
VLSNYVTNALKYSDRYEPIIIEVTLEVDNVRVWVRDKGSGLSEGDQKHIWESYYRTNNAKDQKGSGINLGLGLHICKILIQRHNGDVGVQSKESEGSSFWFSLPIIQ